MRFKKNAAQSEKDGRQAAVFPDKLWREAEKKGAQRFRAA